MGGEFSLFWGKEILEEIWEKMLFLNNKVVISPLKFDRSLFLMGELNPTMLTIHKGGHDSQPWRLLVFFLKMDPP